MITGVNESKKLIKHISCECNCKFDETKSNSNQWWNNDKCRCIKNITYVKKIMFAILLHVIVKIEYIQQVLWMIHLLFVMKLQSHLMNN